MWEKINNILKGQIVTSVLYTALGLSFLLMPVNTVNVVCKFIFGVLLILAGIYHVLIYVLEKMNATLLDLLSGGVILVIGIFLFYNPQIVVKLLPVLLGTFVIVDSIWVLKGSLRLKKAGRDGWQILLAGGIVFILLGIAMILNPFNGIKVTVMFAGGVMAADGVSDLVFLVLLKKNLKPLEEEIPDEIINAAVEAGNVTEEPPEYASWNSRETTEQVPEPEQTDGTT